MVPVSTKATIHFVVTGGGTETIDIWYCTGHWFRISSDLIVNSRCCPVTREKGSGIYTDADYSHLGKTQNYTTGAVSNQLTDVGRGECVCGMRANLLRAY